MVHQVSQAHDAQPDPAGVQGGLAQFGNCGNISVFVNDMIQKDGGQLGGEAQFFPIHRAI